MQSRYHMVFDFDQIDSFIYLGSQTCCEIHFKQKLSDKIEAIICAEDEKPEIGNNLKYFFWLPLKDNKKPTQAWLEIGADLINNLIKNKISSYIYCKNGIDKSVCLMAAYLIKYEGISVYQAVKKIKEKRSQVKLTKLQIEALVNFIGKQK